jgi:hypothetical protein
LDIQNIPEGCRSQRGTTNVKHSITIIRTGFFSRRSTRVTVRKKQVQFNEMVLRVNTKEPKIVAQWILASFISPLNDLICITRNLTLRPWIQYRRLIPQRFYILTKARLLGAVELKRDAPQ